MKINLKYYILNSILIFLFASCSLNEDIEPSIQPKSKGEFTKLSPFDTRLMDLTTYLISIDNALAQGKEKGLDYGRLMWGNGYAYKTDDHEYTIVPFSPDGDKLISLVATKKDGEFVVFIREAPIEEKAGTNINGRVILKSVTGIELYSQWYQDGELLTEAESSFTRLKSGDLEFGNLLPEVTVYGTDMSGGNSNNDWGSNNWWDVENVYPTIGSTSNNDGYDYTGGGGGGTSSGGSYGGSSSSNSNNSFYPAFMQAKQANLTITQISTNKLQIMSPRLDFIENSELVQYPDYSGYFYIYSGYWIYYDVYGENQSIWIENDFDIGQWYDFEFDNTPNLARELTNIIAQIPVELSKTLARYALPIEDAYIVWTGVDFDGIERSPYWAAGGIIFTIMPGGKALKPISKILPGTKMVLGKAGKTWVATFKAFNKYNYRYNLQQLTGKLGINMQAHHVFPQKFANKFSGKINIHDPQYLQWWSTSTHSQKAYEYNELWRQFFEQYPNPNKSQILQEGKRIMKEFGLDVLY